MLKIQYFQNFVCNIFKYYVNSPALACQNWSVIVKDPYAKTEWLVICYEKTVYAVRLGPTFINIPVYQILIAKKVVVSRHLIQRLSTHLGNCTQNLIELEIDRNVDQIDAARIYTFQWKIKLQWALTTDKECKQLSNNNEGILSIYAPRMSKKNLKDIEGLTLNKQFTPFPPDLNGDYAYIPEGYPLKDDYENDKLNSIKIFDFLQQSYTRYYYLL